jgi:flavin reductase (DIM6/NTAB) family NADH-FMN oxidoreductase RutF
MTPDLDPHVLRSAFGSFPSGVVAVAAVVGGQPRGLAASSFTSVSLEPPLVSVSVAACSRTWPLLREAAHVGVSVLADHHDAVCRQLAGPVEQRFSGLPFRSTHDGAVLLDEAVATFDCTVAQEIAAGDHLIVLLALHRVTDGGGASPLVFHRSGFKRLSTADLDQAKLDGRINGKDVDAA